MNPTSLAKAVHYAWTHPLYRKFWSEGGFNPQRDFRSSNDLRKIPVLKKSDLLSMSTRDRSVLDSREYYFFTAVSSGTTNRQLVSLHQYYAVPPYWKFFESLPQCSYSSVLFLRAGTAVSAFVSAALPTNFYRRGSILATGDLYDLSLSAHIAKEIHMDRLVASPTSAVRFARVLSTAQYASTRVKVLHLVGEPLTNASIALMRRLYPQALTLYTYASTEAPSFIGLRSSLCIELEKIHPDAYHFSTRDFIFEVVGGSLVITALHTIPTPLIRYDTGDLVIMSEEFKCSCGFPRGKIGIIGPRIGGMSYKIGTCVFQAEEIRSLLRKVPRRVTEDFLLRLDQIMENDMLLTVPHLTLRRKEHLVSIPFTTAIMRKLFEEELTVRPGIRLSQAIREKLVKPIVITFDQSISGCRVIPPSEITKPFEDVGVYAYGQREDYRR